jgi:hypothetical protein
MSGEGFGYQQKALIYEPVPKLIDCALNAHGFGTASSIFRSVPGKPLQNSIF